MIHFIKPLRSKKFAKFHLITKYSLDLKGIFEVASEEALQIIVKEDKGMFVDQ